MGIKQLYQVIKDHAPDAIKTGEIKNHFGRKVAIWCTQDASMSIYSFLIAVRSDGQQLMSDTGETTSHLMGLFYRTLRIVDNGIKPVYVFDGAPPKLKSGELAKRFQRKSEATEAHEEAKETGTAEEVEKFSRRTVRVTREHNEECKKLLKLMAQQARLEGFFKPREPTEEERISKKRKADEKNELKRKKQKETLKAKKEASAKPRGAA
ncbi:MAG: Ubiquitin-conjugating enzyme E2 4 [Chaenotheca gracillima]|nr:MAG: Ubiquitin-conjugating enzyme E2 4 [Chaenotheca gracillima]